MDDCGISKTGNLGREGHWSCSLVEGDHGGASREHIVLWTCFYKFNSYWRCQWSLFSRRGLGGEQRYEVGFSAGAIRQCGILGTREHSYRLYVIHTRRDS